MLKKELRKIYKEKRSGLSHVQKEKLDDLLLIQFQKLQLPYIDSLLSYWPMGNTNEPNTHIITDFIAFRNPAIQVAYPVTDFVSCEMKVIVTDDNTEFKQNGYGIAEPVAGAELDPVNIDAVLVPLLAFDQRGYRVGYGKGFYDRFLISCREDVLKIGFSYYEPETMIEDINEYDTRMSYCITPDNIYEFPG